MPKIDSEFDPEVVYHLRSAIGRLGRYLRLTHADGRLTPSQREVLGLLVRRGPRRLSLLAAEEGLNLTMASRIVSHLERVGLVTRTPDPDDARVVHVDATEAGRAVVAQIRLERNRALAEAIGSLSVRDRTVLRDAVPVLERLVDALKSDSR